MQGKFITLEGVEGAGKSTSLAYIEKRIREAGRKVLVTREPGGTELGEAIRNLLLGHDFDAMANDTELLLMFAARAEHLNKKIIPALADDIWVLCDRFTDATFAYQGGGRGLPKERIAQLQDFVQGVMRPDLTFLLDLDVDTGLGRAGRRSAPDRFEKEKRDFFEKVRSTYLEAAGLEKDRFRVIDAAVSEQEVQLQLGAVLDGIL